MSRIRTRVEQEVLTVLPDRAADLARWRVLAQGGQPTVTVIGKYNHGKSRLLNELIGDDAFVVADRRQTVALSERGHAGIRWLDAPGLDADITCEDDRDAWLAAWVQSDVRLFVHAAREGELDAAECAVLDRLRRDDASSGRQTLFVLSQADQLASDDALEMVKAAIARQVPDLIPCEVSSTRHRQGLESGKQLLVQKSGIPDLRARLQAACAQVPAARVHETRRLFERILEELKRVLADRRRTRDRMQQARYRQRDAFEQGLASLLDKVRDDLQREAPPCG
jgi:hypothetical protein